MLLAVCLAAPAGNEAPRAAESPAPPPAKGPEFPPNQAGERAASWFEAFNAGEAAMKRYLTSNYAPRAVRRRSLENRMKVYRDMREERGKVTAIEVHEFTESSIRVIARGERGGRFAVTFLCEEKPPHRLTGLLVEALLPEEGTPEGDEDTEYSDASPAR
jgi:hypothetical protein